jgi:cyanophycinase
LNRILLLIFLAFTVRLFSQGFVCAVGGGSENYNSWSDAPYSWIVEKSDSGKIIILGTNAATNWLPGYFMSFGADTAYNKTINSWAAANLQETYDELITARAIFIRGGDQYNYISLWKGTKTDSAINHVFNNGGVIAGTSAGQAVLGDVDFSAQNGTVYPDESLLNPFNNYMRFEDNFLNFVPNVLFDSHFIERGRHGRLIAMLYNRYFLTGRELIGIGIDDRTAFCISPDGIGEVIGSGAATIFTIDNETLFEPMNSGNYTVENLKCEQLTKYWKYNLNSREIIYIPLSAKEVDTQREWELPLTYIWLTGSDNISQHLQLNFPEFVSSVNTGKFIVISHSGFSSQLTLITDYLSQHSLNYEVVYINSSNLNDPVTAQVITSATNFVFAGDSLNVLAMLKDISTLSGEAFREKAVFFQTPIYFFGKSGKTAGQFYTDNLFTDVYAAYRGKMTNNSGLNLFGDMLFEPSLFDDSDYYENRMSSVLWGMMRNRKRFGIYLDGNTMAVFSSDNKTVRGFGTMPPIYIDASQTSWVDSSTFVGNGGIGPRQVVAMNNLRYNITTYDGNGFFILEGRFESSLSVDDEANEFPYNYVLYQNYPNPFNSQTIIEYNLENKNFVKLVVYDLLGCETAMLVNEEKSAGNHKIIFDASYLPSGIYFYRLFLGDNSTTKSMLLLK